MTVAERINPQQGLTSKGDNIQRWNDRIFILGANEGEYTRQYSGQSNIWGSQYWGNQNNIGGTHILLGELHILLGGTPNIIGGTQNNIWEPCKSLDMLFVVVVYKNIL
jgi:hypothetical protein